jgi:hypothetical protein
MAKITRKTQKVFGESAGATGIIEYGSAAAGSPVATTDPDDIQTTAWETGWAAAALAGTEIPSFQDFNGIHFVATRQIGYLLQEGLAEYDAGTEYHANSIVKKSGTYELYGSITNSNTGNALPSQTDNANWKYLGDLSGLVDVGNSVFTEEYVSANQTITAAGSLTLAHGLSSEPKLIQVYLECQTGELNYTAGQKILVNNHFTNDGSAGATSRGVAVVPDATNLNIRFGSNTQTFNLLNYTTGGGANITNANWELIVKAYA